ncbi:uncharacterized protein [Macrobrachium rosenbergii]|uniref:uncharacterized protein n=1 Tax=Macrobrachium rosenbergii TaxID=79674 RepID=UPI0034D6B20B
MISMEGRILRAPNWVVKHTLEVSFRRKIFNEEQVRTLVKEAEAVLNNRPLMYTGSSREEGVLTPSQLTRGSMVRLMSLVVLHENMCCTLTTKQMCNQYFRLTNNLRMFRHRWQTEYSSSLQERRDFRVGAKSSLSVGDIDIVLVKLDHRKRSYWPLGRIVAIYPGDDGVIRSVSVLYEGEKTLRPVEHIIPLEMSACGDSEGEEYDKDNEHIDEVNAKEDTAQCEN